MKLVGNLIWIFFGGWAIALEYIVVGIGLCTTIVGIPFGLQCFKLAMVGFVPFGQQVESQDRGSLSMLLNIVWFVFAGAWIFLTHLLFGLLFCITIIGLPFGLQHFKLAGLALSPFGRKLL